MTDPSDFSRLERAKRCRERAAEAKRDAERSAGAIRDGYLLLERGWLALADDLETAAKRAGDRKDPGEQKVAAFRPPKAPTD